MTSFVNYLIESGISLSLFALVYFLFLRRETFFSINRWFLLVSIGFSAVLPLLHIPFYTPQPTLLAEVTVTPYVNLLSTITIYGSGFTHEAETLVLSYSLFGYVYLIGVVLFAVKLFIQLFQIGRLIKQNRVIAEGKFKLVVLDREISPFSFLNYIFVSSNLQNTKGWEKMLEHERQHIRQGHTFDVLLLEIIAIVQWFNPFFWMFRRALRENHEFLADQAVISHGTAPSWYKQILINQYVGDQIVIANNFNYSLIKIRIKMMSKIKSSKITYAKILLGIILAGSLTASFAFEQKKSTSIPPNPEKQTKTILVDGHEVQISGDKTGVEKLLNAIAKSEAYGLLKDAKTGKLTLGEKTGNKTLVDEAVEPKIQLSSGEEVFMVVDEMPVFPGGDQALRNFLAQAVKYPPEAVKKGIQGKVYVTFVVNKDGSVSNAKIARGVDPSLDAEALRVVKLLPKWKPGKQKGQDVAVQYTVPIKFALQ
ncbi:regulatory sensor-transducer, BlaR1/MecR1 family [Aquipluma nitroreducens]|uniref:Regulatory sensor-transducer, BlaR1/MecR1 family n=1 Tax=Aquipluma nitroreducens TaxID=2010828 RepID=A0A5K7SFJ5_9BACT|nr:M56 family metallopeptidase [Aquipluma nitroreducens]BBE20323.1 regulatory sensor-transducer, BlaR1/MecR1 family [Aquipluma nitroreducens]